MTKLSRTERCIIMDALRPGGIRLAPCAAEHLKRLRAGGYIRFRKLKDGWFKVVTLKVD